MQKVEMEMRMKNREPNATYWKKGRNQQAEKKDRKREQKQGRRKSQLQIKKTQQGKQNIVKHKEKLQHW